jgi:C terminal of Calcineurin-like phosphoesterase/Calcineurin-like phosphoesterase
MDSGRTRRAGPTRREVMAAAGASALALTAGAGLAQPPAAASGFVFEDRNRKGRREPGDRGIPGVMVSNGRDVVRTDAEGRWGLPVADGDSLFVVKPPHWSTPVGQGGVPQFSRLHQPKGSPQDIAYRHAGVAGTGALPASIDFALMRHDESAGFEALLFADTQPENGTELGYLRDDIIAGALGTKAAFGINHGDVVFDDLSLYPRYLQVLGATGLPWHHCPGNHDINSEARDDRCSRETWKRVFGPRHYAFQHAGATFIVLDNVHYFGHNPGAPGSGTYCGLIGERQLQFVRNVLAQIPPEQLVVLSMHIPLATYQAPTSPADNTADRNALLRLLSARPHTVSFSGHMHLTEHHYLLGDAPAGAQGPHHHHVLAAASGGWWGGPHDGRGIPSADSPDGSPNGFHILAVDGAEYTTRFVPAAGKTADQIRVVVDGPSARRRRTARADAGAGEFCSEPIAADELAACELVVNVFDGGPRTKVTYEIAGRRPALVPMQRTTMRDPFIVQLFARSEPMQKRWVRAVPSSHVWKAPLPADLDPGAHRVTVRATDEYGRERVTHILLEVGPRGAAASPA